MVPLSKVQDLIAKHSKLEKELSSQEIDKKTFAEKSKEYSDLNDVIKEAISYFNFEKNKEELEKLINDNDLDKEMKDLAISELNELEKNNGRCLLVITNKLGDRKEITLQARLDTAQEYLYYKRQGVLPYVLEEMMYAE